MALRAPRELDRRRAGGEDQVRTNFLVKSGFLWRCRDLLVTGEKGQACGCSWLLTRPARAGKLRDFGWTSPCGTLLGRRGLFPQPPLGPGAPPLSPGYPRN